MGYSEEKLESEKQDQALGFRIQDVEAKLAERLLSHPVSAQTWSHLSPQIFQTPYSELSRIVREANPDSHATTWVDLGAAYGRLGIVLAREETASRFVGIEIVPERVAEAKRVYLANGIDPLQMRCEDLAECEIPRGEIYFVYDFGNRSEIQRVLSVLRDYARANTITVVGRGRLVRDVIEREHPWLSGVIPPKHSTHYSIYRSA